MNHTVPFNDCETNTITQIPAAKLAPGMISTSVETTGGAKVLNEYLHEMVESIEAKRGGLGTLARKDHASETTAMAVHEAGHGVVAALCGFEVVSVGLSLEGGSMDRVGRSPMLEGLPQGVGGVCYFVDDSLVGDLIKWDGDRFNADREKFAFRLAKLSPEERKEELRKVRGLITAALAGPIATSLFEDEYFEEGCIELCSDLTRAACIAGLLDPKEIHGFTGGEEFYRMVEWTEKTLRGHWLSIHRLANALEKETVLEGVRLIDLLPSKLGGWIWGKWRSFPPARKGKPAFAL